MFNRCTIYKRLATTWLRGSQEFFDRRIPANMAKFQKGGFPLISRVLTANYKKKRLFSASSTPHYQRGLTEKRAPLAPLSNPERHRYMVSFGIQQGVRGSTFLCQSPLIMRRLGARKDPFFFVVCGQNTRYFSKFCLPLFEIAPIYIRII